MTSEAEDSGCWKCGYFTAGFIFALILTALFRTNTTFRFYVKMTYYLFGMVVCGLFGGFISLPFGRSPKNHFRIFKIFHYYTMPLKLHFTLRNKKYIDSDKPFILIANHQSCLDVLGMSWCWPQNCVVMLKSSLKFFPGFNLCAYVCNSIYINRFVKEKAHATVDATLEAINNDGRKVWIYPEGTRNPGKEFLPFKRGAFTLAQKAKIPIVCCVFSSHRFFYEFETRRFEDSGDVLVDFLPPIDSTKFNTVDELSDHCYKIMSETHAKLNKEVEQMTNKKLD